MDPNRTSSPVQQHRRSGNDPADPPTPKPNPSQSWDAITQSSIRVSPRPPVREMEPDQMLSSASTPEPHWTKTSDKRKRRTRRRQTRRKTPVEPSPSLFSREPLDRNRPMMRVRSSDGPTVHKRPRSMSNPEVDGPRHPTMLLRKSAMIARPPPTKRPRTMTPEEVAQKVQDDQLMREIGQRRDEVFIPGPREPPINMQTLKSLDASEILRNPQLRHDLLFDSLAFRPVNAKVPLATQYVGVPTKDKPPVVDPSATCDVSEMYWECIRAEVETGCRCTRWVKLGDGKIRVENCICGRWRHELSEGDWWRLTKPTWPSRLPKLISTLRHILESLMASTTPCVNHFAHAASKEMMQRHEAVCPTVTHTLVPELFAALDPDFLTIQARRGVFGLQVFRVLGEAMKVHCAPVRDEMVDDMVNTACKPDIVGGLRKAFDCVEVMKLDIANHQVHAVRPMLWTQAEQNEMMTFKNYLVQTKRTVATSKTKAWFRNASMRALKEAAPDARAHLVGKCACHNVEEFLARSLAEGVSELVFGGWIGEEQAWPPVVPSRLQVMQLAEPTAPCPVSLPEVFKMDHRRLRNFHCDMVDLAICQIVTRAYRSKLEPMAEWKEAKLVKVAVNDYKYTMTHGDGVISATGGSDLALRLARRALFPYAPLSETTLVSDSVEDATRITQTAIQIDRFIAENTARNSPLFVETLSQLRRVVTKLVADALVTHSQSKAPRQCSKTKVEVPTSTEVRDTARPAAQRRADMYDAHQRTRDLWKDQCEVIKSAGFESQSDDVRALVDRVLRIVGFNHHVFGPVYRMPGMLFASGR